ncbi:MAG: deoxyguanosinetriphosphate triphosphohydrolase [Candidatus Auribacter fodinae]|jgi:dGTPase|uniref:Deoxyguanosinetriphosphate triphosphohydrolase-like protein n=1 Tax=Candidatus Auribacter fodinae TaxID=2093366 RepID=A0A3A4R5Y4_9BACT|nr:MAG: deoxyguanosinetriphosphate triphosphohydrolase [Candidatus Auribacter fodinae]
MTLSVFDRDQLEQNEHALLAPYAMKSNMSKGRLYNEPEHPYRSRYQRDRDRIVHSRAFRRLEYKTQVFVNSEGDHFRTRLTHTLEVAMITRTIGRCLRLNEDLIETLALAHDMGHPAFGHSGEQKLNQLMQEHGGFEHNHQTLRIVELLEKKYPDFDGLNLTWEVREGIIKHSMDYNKPEKHQYDPYKAPLLEVQAVNIGDEIAYNSHDLDDGLSAGLFTFSDLAHIDIWREAFNAVNKKYHELDEKTLGSYVVREIIDRQVQDVLTHTQHIIQQYGISSVDDVRNTMKPIVTLSPELEQKNKELKEYLYKNFYTHYQVEIMNQKGLRIIQELFELFINNPRLLDPSTLERLNHTPLQRVVCDYIAGMTDRYAFNTYRKLCSLSERYNF